MPMEQTAMRFAALRQAEERAAREGVGCTAYRERCDGETRWYVRSDAESIPPARPRATVEMVVRVGPPDEDDAARDYVLGGIAARLQKRALHQREADRVAAEQAAGRCPTHGSRLLAECPGCDAALGVQREKALAARGRQ